MQGKSVKQMPSKASTTWCLAITLALATWFLLAIGAIVNPMEASLACPDWLFIPTCNHQIFPPMKAGVLYEHGHRLWACFVGLLTISLALRVWFTKHTSSCTRMLSLFAIVMVAAQGTLGGVTVLLGLHPLISSLHLVMGFAFFCLTLELAIRLCPFSRSLSVSKPPWGSRSLWVALFLTFAQVALGGLVRHMGAALACGNDWIGCGLGWWPKHGLGHLHMTHRIVGYLLAIKILGFSIRCHRQSQSASHIIWAWIPTLLIMIQVLLGWASVASLLWVGWVVLHTCTAATLVGLLFMMCRTAQIAAPKAIATNAPRPTTH
ncbi:MAG: COX15/CtaA family protein [Myxococcota bacterium]